MLQERLPRELYVAWRARKRSPASTRDVALRFTDDADAFVRCFAILIQAWSYCIERAFSIARDLLERAAPQLARCSSPYIQASAAVIRLHSHIELHDFPSPESLQALEAEVEALGEVELQINFHNVMGIRHIFSHDVDALKRHLNRALLLCRDHGFVDTQIPILLNLGIAQVQQKHYPEAIQTFQNCFAFDSLWDSPTHLGALHQMLGFVLTAVDDERGALENYKRAVDYRRESGSPAQLCHTLCSLAGSYILFEMFDEAARALEEVRHQLPDLHSHEILGNYLNTQLDLMWLADDAARIREMLRHPLDLDSLGDVQRFMVDLNRARLCRLAGDFTDARTQLAALQVPEPLPLLSRFQHQREVILVHTALGSPITGIAFEALLEIADAVEPLRLQKFCLERLGELLGDIGQYALAYRCVRRSHQLDRERIQRRLHGSADDQRALFELERFRSEARAANLKRQQMVQLNTSLHQANTQLSSINTRLKTLMDRAAHDLRSPLAVIRLSAELAKKELCHREPGITRHLQLILSAEKQLTGMLSEMMSQNTDQRAVLLKQIPCDIAPMLFAIVRSHSDHATRKAIGLDVMCAPGMSALGDPVAIREVVENLVVNALKYTQPGGAVRVTAAVDADADQVRIDVEDNGPGLSTEDQRNLFKRFQRLTPQPTGGEPSIGLGLYIVRQLVEQMGGQIHCTSTLGVGSRFTVRLPR
ncbi:MAG: HAMP domain-containing sensor histidine kinase [Myxococcota bacterium]